MAHIKYAINDGQRFNMLTVVCYAGKSSHGDRVFKCVCDCGKETTATASDLMSGNKKSCGCLHGENHGHSDDRLYGVWQTMKARCNRPTNQKYKDYGGRGISVCAEWQNSFTSFREWALKNGYDYDAPYGKCTIDRIDVNGDYEPSNCRWVDMKTQVKNQRPHKSGIDGIAIDYKGKHYRSISELARDYGIHPARIERRIHRMSIEEALSEIRASIITNDGLLKSIRYVSENKWNKIIQMREQGASFKEIGERLGMTKLLVQDVIDRHKLGKGSYFNQLPTKLIGSTGITGGARL